MALLLAACTGPGADRTPPASRAASVATDGGPDRLGRFYGQRLDWAGCGGGFSCARLRVPLDYRRPEGRQLSLAVVRLPAAGRRLGSLVLNPGGPGASGIAYARAAPVLIGQRLRGRFDVVGFDPRGVGASAPVDCLDGPQLDALFALPPAPRTAAERAAVTRAFAGLAAACRARSRDLLAHVSTADTARDLDVLRAALGDARLTYLGKSYGTYLGTKYLELFPRRARAAVLDGAVDPTLTPAQVNAGQAAGFTTALDRSLRSCGAAGTCGTSPSDAQARLQALLHRLDTAPLPAPRAPGSRRLTAGTALYGLAAGLYSPDSWPQLAAVLREAEAGDGSGLLRLADAYTDRSANGTYSNELEASDAVNCVDRPSPRDPAAYAAQARALARQAPVFGPAIAWMGLVCAYWPVPATDAASPARAAGAPTALVVGTTLDPATPYPWAVHLTAQLHGRLLTFVGDGHTAYRRGSACIDAAVEAYLLDLHLPAPGTRCS